MPKYKKLTVELYNDPDAPNPSDEDGWKLYSFSRRHINFKDPNELLPPDAELTEKLKSGLAFILSYFEHGQCSWMLKGGSAWDSCPDKRWDGTATAGVLIWEQNESDLGPRTAADRTKDAEGFLETYTAWCNGNCYGYSIEDENGEDIDRCSGFLNCEKEMFSEIRSYTDDAEEVEVTGEAKWLADYYDIKTKKELVGTV